MKYPISYLATKLGVSKDQVLEAIKVIGNDRQKIEAYLKK
jgi:hypothetical protein